MEIVLRMKMDSYEKMKNKLLKDDLVSRASMTFKETKAVDQSEGYYCYISGTEEQCKKALEMMKDRNPKTGEEFVYAEEVSGKEKEKVIEKIKGEEEKASEAFGGIFG